MSTPPNPPTILVVDDQAPVRSFIVRALKTAGWNALEAANGRVALGVLSREKVDLLITDLVMPEGEGIELIIAAKRTYGDKPIIAISGEGVLGPGQFLEAARLLGAKRTLTKPFDVGTLLGAVREVLGLPTD
jgi:CheY-like chemotaxis protein